MAFSIRKVMIFILLSLCMSLAACHTNTPKLPHVRYESATYPIVFGDGVTRLSVSEKSVLADFLATVPASAVAAISLTTDDTKIRSIARARNLRDYLIRQGFTNNIIRLTPSYGMDPRMVVLTLHYSKGIPPEPCPDWSDNPSISYQDSVSSDFGCAYYNNFIIQLANPADYNGGHAKPAISAPRDSVVLQKYFSPPSTSGSGSPAATSSTP